MTVSNFPLTWPSGWERTPDYKRRSSSPFKATFERARQQLLNELKLLKATGTVISSNIPVRNDGMLYADAARRRIDDPGVAIYFIRNGKQVVMARDLYWSPYDNLRSICLAIEAMRSLERHGGGSMMERAFEGFTALADHTNVKRRQWWEVLGFQSNPKTEDPAVNAAMAVGCESAYRKKAKEIHPDVGGSAEAMTELNDAIQQARSTLS